MINSGTPGLGPARVTLVPDVDHGRCPVIRVAGRSRSAAAIGRSVVRAGPTTLRTGDEICKPKPCCFAGRDDHMLAPVGGDQAVERVRSVGLRRTCELGEVLRGLRPGAAPPDLPRATG